MSIAGVTIQSFKSNKKMSESKNKTQVNFLDHFRLVSKLINPLRIQRTAGGTPSGVTG